MSRTSRILILLLVVVLGFGGRAFAADKAIIVSGQETPGDSGTITISFSDSAGHNYSESVVYGQYSTAASIASAFGVMFSRDYLSLGLCAHAVGSTIDFHLRGAVTFGTPTINNPSTSFSVGASALSVATASLPTGTQYAAYNTTLQATGGQSPYTWTYNGQLPAGLQLSSSGVISGTPTWSGTDSITVIVSDAAQSRSEASLSISFTAVATAPATGSVAYTYDSQGRVQTAAYTTSAGTVTVTYSYDNVGNRTSVVTQ